MEHEHIQQLTEHELAIKAIQLRNEAQAHFRQAEQLRRESEREWMQAREKESEAIKHQKEIHQRKFPHWSNALPKAEQTLSNLPKDIDPTDFRSVSRYLYEQSESPNPRMHLESPHQVIPTASEYTT